jgi:EAL domain-containing protein (putative c-di-GMP-specific phosphodiesterase class I)
LIKNIKISTKNQNIFLGMVLALIFLTLGFNSYKDFSDNKNKITNIELAQLTQKVDETEKSLNRYFSSIFTSLGEIYYDDRIKKATLTVNSRLFKVYQEKAYTALREFILFKDLKNILLFDGSYNLISAINRSVFIDAENLDLIKKRLENYKHKQVIFQTINNNKQAILILKLNYSESNSAYIVVIEDLSEITKELSAYETNQREFFLFTKTLDYRNSLIKLKQGDSYGYYSLQENSLLRFNSGFIRSFNAQGEETISRVKDLDDFQYSFVLGLTKPDYLNAEVLKYKAQLSSYYTFWLFWSVLLAVLYALVVYSKLNIVNSIIFAKKQIIKVLNFKEHEQEPQELVKEAKKQAYSYIEDENAIKNSVYKVYNSLRKMSPEDIRNLSIKNSLSKENIRLFYQPVIDSKTMQPQFCEVFLRLLNYYGDELMPSEFIPVLAHFNMLENLDEMMLEKVLKKIQTLQSTDPSAKISLNISKGAFNSDKFLHKLKASLIKGNINTENVMLEIPDFEILNNEEHAEFIKDLTGYGVHFAVSVENLDAEIVNKLASSNISYIRIDMSHFSDVLENKIKQDLLKQIISNSKKNNLQIIAERIETEFMFKLAKSLDIPLLQGYYIGKPKKYYTHK